MKPIYTDEDRAQAVRNFIAARYQGLAKIRDYSPVTSYMKEKRIKLLYEVAASGIKVDSHYNAIGKFFIDSDAEKYFEWLVSVVTGAENVSEGVIKQAIDQLFIFILTMRDGIDIDKRVKLVEAYDWEQKLDLIAKVLLEFRESTEKRDQKITDILRLIFDWMKQYRLVLDEVKKDYGDKLGRALGHD
jgi:hypothetical protein